MGRELAYLIYNGVHYYPIVHERQGELVLNENITGWVAPPSKQKRVEQTQAEIGTGSEEDEADHGRARGRNKEKTSERNDTNSRERTQKEKTERK